MLKKNKHNVFLFFYFKNLTIKWQNGALVYPNSGTLCLFMKHVILLFMITYESEYLLN